MTLDQAQQLGDIAGSAVLVILLPLVLRMDRDLRALKRRVIGQGVTLRKITHPNGVSIQP